MKVNFYVASEGRQRYTDRKADHTVHFPTLELSLITQKKPKDLRRNAIKAVQSWIDLEISCFFEIGVEDPQNVAKWFVDDDGDCVILNDPESFKEAIKIAGGTNNVLHIVVSAPLKPESNNKAAAAAWHLDEQLPPATIPEMSRPHAVRQYAEPPSEPPSWLMDCMSQVKKELMEEIRSSIGPTSPDAQQHVVPQPSKAADTTVNQGKTSSTSSSSSSSRKHKSSTKNPLSAADAENRNRLLRDEFKLYPGSNAAAGSSSGGARLKTVTGTSSRHVYENVKNIESEKRKTIKDAKKAVKTVKHQHRSAIKDAKEDYKHTRKLIKSSSSSAAAAAAAVDRKGCCNSSKIITQQDKCSICTTDVSHKARLVCLEKDCKWVGCEICVKDGASSAAGHHRKDHVLLRVPSEPTEYGRRLIRKYTTQKENASWLEKILTPAVGGPDLVHPKTTDNPSNSTSSSFNDPVTDMMDKFNKLPLLSHTPLTPTAPPSNTAGVPTQPPCNYDMEIMEESDTRLMNSLTENSGAYWKRWTLKNCGLIPWDSNVQCLLVGTCGDGVQAFAPEASVPYLEPGQTGEIVVWVYGPLEGNGEYHKKEDAEDLWSIPSSGNGGEQGDGEVSKKDNEKLIKRTLENDEDSSSEAGDSEFSVVVQEEEQGEPVRPDSDSAVEDENEYELVAEDEAEGEEKTEADGGSDHIVEANEAEKQTTNKDDENNENLEKEPENPEKESGTDVKETRTSATPQQQKGEETEMEENEFYLSVQEIKKEMDLNGARNAAEAYLSSEALTGQRYQRSSSSSNSSSMIFVPSVDGDEMPSMAANEDSETEFVDAVQPNIGEEEDMPIDNSSSTTIPDHETLKGAAEAAVGNVSIDYPSVNNQKSEETTIENDTEAEEAAAPKESVGDNESTVGIITEENGQIADDIGRKPDDMGQRTGDIGPKPEDIGPKTEESGSKPDKSGDAATNGANDQNKKPEEEKNQAGGSAGAARGTQPQINLDGINQMVGNALKIAGMSVGFARNVLHSTSQGLNAAGERFQYRHGQHSTEHFGNTYPRSQSTSWVPQGTQTVNTESMESVPNETSVETSTVLPTSASTPNILHGQEKQQQTKAAAASLLHLHVQPMKKASSEATEPIQGQQQQQQSGPTPIQLQPPQQQWVPPPMRSVPIPNQWTPPTTSSQFTVNPDLPHQFTLAPNFPQNGPWPMLPMPSMSQIPPMPPMPQIPPMPPVPPMPPMPPTWNPPPTPQWMPINQIAPAQQETTATESNNTNSTNAAVVGNAEEHPEYNRSVDILAGMGFTDVNRILTLLQLHNNDLNNVVDTLLMDFQLE